VKSFLVAVVDRSFRDLMWSAMNGDTMEPIHPPTNGRAEYKPFCQQNKSNVVQTMDVKEI